MRQVGAYSSKVLLLVHSGDPYQLLQGDGPALMPPVPLDPPKSLFGELEGSCRSWDRDPAGGDEQKPGA